MQTIVPSLWFDREAEEAVAFYVSTFPNSRITDVARYGPAGPGPEGTVMTIDFELDGFRVIAINGGPEFRFTEAISLRVDCESQDEVDRLWDRLTEGGEPGPCGWLKDRYGLSWQIVPVQLGRFMTDPDPERRRRVTEAMLGMGKLDVGELQAAYDGAASEGSAKAVGS